jgi:peptide/nickel transport system substrate-binding protein
MDRRAFLKSFAGAGTIVAAGGLATPAISLRAATRTVRLVPHADLANFDPIWTPAYIARNAGVLVWDTLYGIDAQLQVQRQMVEAEEVSTDGLIWTFRLRPALKFHDGEPVLARDAVASINRWAARDPLGLMIKAIENELVAVDDRTFRWVLRKPYPKMLLALGKMTTPCCFVMPARIAATDPFKQITEHVGSGPMRFVRGDWLPGALAAFEKFVDYVPRQEEASWLAGGKRIQADRVEFVVIPDGATAAAALQTGEVDWWEFPLPDLVPILRNNRNVVVGIQDRLGNAGVMSINHLFPPFNDVRARRAILMALSQPEYMQAFTGDDASLWRPLPGYVSHGSPYYNDEGGEILKGARQFDAAKNLLSQSGYAGEPIVCLAAQEIPSHKAFGDVTVDLLKRLGMNVDFAAVDWGTVVARRAQKKPPSQGGWHIFHTTIYGVDCAAPISSFVHADGSSSVNGWASSTAVEAEIAAWFDATSFDAESAAMRRFNKVALEQVVYAPLGWYQRHHAWRRNLAGVAPGPFPMFWDVSKIA